jgi:hypothetical protein
MKFIIPALLALSVAGIAQADPPRLIDRQTDKYLGNLSTNQYDPHSVNRENGVGPPILPF